MDIESLKDICMRSDLIDSGAVLKLIKTYEDAIKECVSQLEWHNQHEPSASTNVVLTRMYKLLGDKE